MKGPNLPKWTKPGFLGIGSKLKSKPDQFGIPRKAEANVPIEMKLGDANLRWEDTSWVNSRLKEPNKNANPSMLDIKEMKTKNAQLQIECEILLNILTEVEIKKARMRRELADKKMIMLQLADKVEAQMAEE